MFDIHSLTGVIPFHDVMQSIRVGQAVNGDHTSATSHCQKTQSGQVRSLYEICESIKTVINTKVKMLVVFLITSYRCV